MLAAQFTPGTPENIYIGQVPVPELKDGEVLIKVYATAINRADCLQRKGLYAPPPGQSDILGLEAVGIIDKLHSTCKGSWKEGQRVMALLTGGGNGEYVAVPEQQLMPVPSGMSFTTAAAIPEVWLTAYQLLHFAAGLKPSDTVLVHAGASGVGTAAVQLINLHGAKSLVTAGSPAKIDKAKSLGASEGFNYKDGPWAEKVLKATDGQGVSVVLDCVGGSYWQQNAEVLSTDGRWVLYGGMGGLTVNGDIMAKILRKRLTLIGSTLRARSVDYKGELVGAFSENVLPHLASGRLSTVVDRILPLNQLSTAHAIMEKNENTGKIIIQVRNDDKENHGEL